MASASGSAGADAQWVEIDQHRLRLTNLGKVMYPETGTTKGEVLDYYARVADALLPLVRDRPVTRKRWVDGVGTADAPGQVFFQKNVDEGAPEWVQRRGIEHSDHVTTYPLVPDRATLIWIAQVAGLELHVPQWRFGRTGARRDPDRLVLDLDPGEGAGLAECAAVARWARTILAQMGLDPFPVTSGSKGIHLYCALDGSQTSAQVSEVAHELARVLEADHPDLVVSEMRKTLRRGKVLVDWSQNNGNKTTIAPYSLRGRPHPTVAAPRTWDEIEDPALDQLAFAEVLERLAAGTDPIATLGASHRAALEPTPEHLDGFASTPESVDRLARYRSMRDAARTPEPVPASAPGPPAGTSAPPGASFVIQEHHARRLHWDFRLEHDGVLVSWALPKGVPTDPARNHLAVQTEDHPLEYGAFEGTIPAGEYGGGEVAIWDAGEYELHTWREGEEVIATLHGERHGTRTYALIRTGGRGRSESGWLIHLMPGRPAWADGDASPGTPGAPAPVVDPLAASAPRPARAFARASAPEPSAPARTLPSPMLATATTARTLPRNVDWAYEMKWDGIRALVDVRDGAVRLVTRTGNDVTRSYPELGAVGDAVAGDALLDGEIVTLDASGAPSFSRLQNRMNLTGAADIARARERYPVLLFAFDVLEAGGDDVRGRRYDERRELLERIVAASPVVQVPPAFDGDLAAALAVSRELHLEGVMAKDRRSDYTARRSSSWLKLKHTRTQEVVVAGWKPGRGRRAGGVGSLLLGVPDADGLRYVGKVGTGFRDRDLDEMADRFRTRERRTSPLADVPAVDARDARWVTADLVGEVEFGEWTPTGRLRQPSWRGWRPDKLPADVRVEEP